MMFFTLNIMENIRYFNTKISHFNYIFKIIQYILYYCRILCHWWASAGAGVIVVIITVVVSGHLQLPVLPSASVDTCRCRWGRHRPMAPAAAGGVAVGVRWQLQVQMGSSLSIGTCSCRWCCCRPVAPAVASVAIVVRGYLQGCGGRRHWWWRLWWLWLWL